MIRGEKENEVLNMLLNAKDYLTSSEIANQLLVSTKTVSRLINSINNYQSSTLIIGTKGRGYKINYSVYITTVVMHRQKVEQISDEDRLFEVIYKLLSISPTQLKVNSLFMPYYLSDSVIEQDIKKVKKYLVRYEIEVSHKNQRISILGNEADVRRAMQDLLIKQNILDTNLKVLKPSILNRYLLDFSVQQLKILEGYLEVPVPFPYNINIVINIYILLLRHQVGNSQKNEQTHLSLNQMQKIIENRWLYKAFSSIVENMEGFLVTGISDSEQFRLMQYLIYSRLTEDSAIGSATEEEKARRITAFFCQQVTDSLNLFSNHEVLLHELLDHIRPMLNRINHGINVHNPLLKNIQQEYAFIFSVVFKTAKQVPKKFHIPELSVDEVGFITLYFARFLEENRKPINALVVCTSGVATSKLIETKLQLACPDINVIGTSSRAAVSEIIEVRQNVNLIISTVPISLDIDIPAIIVSALLSSKDQKRIQFAVARLRGSEKMLSDITKPALIQLDLEVNSWQEAIRKSANPLVTEGFATQDYIDGMVKTSEESGPYIVISKGVALPHARPELGAKRVGVGITTLKKPIDFGNKTNDPVSFVFSLCAIDNKSHLRALSELVDFVGDRYFLKRLSDAKNEDAVYQLILSYEERMNQDG